MKEINEDLCSYCIEDQQTINEYESYNEFIKNVINGYLHENIIYDIIKNNKVNNNEYIIYDIIDIEKRFYKDYINNSYLSYIKDIIYIEDIFMDKTKPDVNIFRFKGKVDYLDFKIDVYKNPIKNNSIYSDIFDKYILYYKHVANSDNTRHIERYIAYICYLENGKQEFLTFSFIKLFKILNKVYNKHSIINHIKDITNNILDISNLI